MSQLSVTGGLSGRYEDDPRPGHRAPDGFAGAVLDHILGLRRAPEAGEPADGALDAADFDYRKAPA